MPYVLTQPTSHTSAHLRLWPHNALAPRGYVTVIAMTAGTLAIPMIAVLGSPVLWALLPFAVLALWGLWFALDRNFRDRQILEDMTLSRTSVSLMRHNPNGPVQNWSADPHWVTLSLAPNGGPVEQYLTMTGGGREVELGAFLTPDERSQLYSELNALLIRLKSYA